MPQLSKEAACARLQKLYDEARGFFNQSPEHAGWQRSAIKSITRIFGKDSSQLSDFKNFAGIRHQRALLKSIIDEVENDEGNGAIKTIQPEQKTGSPGSDARQEDMPMFPDITPSKITESMMYVIEREDIKTEQDFQELIRQMFEYPDRDFYFFQEKEGPRNDLMVAADRLGTILMSETEFFYYRHPNFKRDYVKIERRDGKYNWDWEKEVVEKGPMFMRSTLKLTGRTRLQLETQQRIAMEDAYRKTLSAKNNYDVFLSYDSRDQQLANEIFEAITSAGGKGFLSEKSLKPGEDFADTIRNALRSSRELWVLVSPNSLKSDWVISEWGAAWALEKKIVPILYRCAPESLPDRIRRLHCVDFHKYQEVVSMTFPKEPTPI